MKDQSTRSQSEVLGVVLLLGMSVVTIGAVVFYGGVAMDQTYATADAEGTSQSMTQFASQAALVAHGESDSQTVTLTGSDDNIRSVNGSAGTLYVETPSQSASVTMGKIVSEQENAEIAFQGGGVWKKQEGGTTMVSSPEFHYRVDQGGTPTLTLPLVAVRGDNIGDQVQVTQDGDTQNLLNDIRVDSGETTVTVNSEYYQAWGRFFEQRTTGEVEYDHDEQNATVTLKAPADGAEVPAAVTTGAAVTLDGGNGQLDGYSDGTYGNPFPDEEAAARIDGDLDVQNQFVVNGDVHATGDGSIGNNIDVTGDMYIGDKVSFDNNPDLLGGDIHAGNFDYQANVELNSVYTDSVENIDASGPARITGDFHANQVVDYDGINNGIGGDVVTNSDFDLGDDLDVDGDVSVGGQLFGGSDITVGGNLIVEDWNLGGGMDVGGTLHVHDSLTLSSKYTGADGFNVKTSGPLTVNDDIDGNLNADDDIDAANNIDIGGDVTATGDVTLQNKARVDGDVTAGGSITCLGSATITGDAVAGGSISPMCVQGSESANASPSVAVSPASPKTAQSPTEPEVPDLDAVNQTIINKGNELQDPADNNNDDEDCIVSRNIDLTAAGCSPNTIEAGSYYLDQADVNNALELDTSDGDIIFYVDQSVNINNAVTVTGGNRVEFYVENDDIVIGSGVQVSAPDDHGDRVWFYQHSQNANAELKNNAKLQGVLFGPGGPGEDGADISLQENSQVFGAVVGDVNDANQAEIHFDKNLLESEGGGGDELETPKIAYLHISETKIVVE